MGENVGCRKRRPCPVARWTRLRSEVWRTGTVVTYHVTINMPHWSCQVCYWKKFENRSAFGRVISKIEWHLYGHSVLQFTTAESWGLVRLMVQIGVKSWLELEGTSRFPPVPMVKFESMCFNNGFHELMMTDWCNILQIKCLIVSLHCPCHYFSRESCRRREMYSGHPRLCVCVCVCVSACLSAAVRPHYCTDPDVTWGCGRGCSLVKCTIGRIRNRGTGCVAMAT